MSGKDSEPTRLDDRKAEIAAKLEAAKRLREERHAAAKVKAEEKAAARAQAKLEAEERAAAHELAKAEAKAAERAKEQQRQEARAQQRGGPPANVPIDLTGRQRLIDAAMRLHREKRSFLSLGIREIAREANLNPNTFYRHFESIDDLAVAAVVQCGDRLRPMLHQIHRLASRVDPATVAALEVSAFYAFVLGNSDAFAVGVTEYHGGSPRVRASIDALLHEVAAEMRDDITATGIFPMISRDHLEIACTHVVVHLFHLSQEYIEKPERREAIVEASECMIVWIFAGAALGTPANLAALTRQRAPVTSP